jgi:hypothetical protein
MTARLAPASVVINNDYLTNPTSDPNLPGSARRPQAFEVILQCADTHG